jgi:hypothetical protein
MEEGQTKAVICQGDLVYFYVDNTGFFSFPSLDEPISERSDVVSHLRAIRSPSAQLPPDFNLRFVPLCGLIF